MTGREVSFKKGESEGGGGRGDGSVILLCREVIEGSVDQWC